MNAAASGEIFARTSPQPAARSRLLTISRFNYILAKLSAHCQAKALPVHPAAREDQNRPAHVEPAKWTLSRTYGEG
jgi:hypothetical protein